MGIDKRAIERLTQNIQREFDKHPIRVPIHADGDGVLPPASTVNNYHGPTVVMTGDGAQAVAWNSGTVNQAQSNVSQIAPGYEALAELLTNIVASLDTFGLPEDEAEFVREEATAVLEEVTTEEPNPGRIKKALMLVRGALQPVAAGANQAATAESAELARKAIEHLTGLM